MKIPFFLYAMLFSIVAGLYGFIRKKNHNNLYLTIFPFFLIIALSVELIGPFLIQIKRQQNTLLLYNIFTSVEFTFYLWVIREIIKSKSAKKIMFFILLFYPLAALINIFFFQGRYGFHSFTYALGCLLIVGCCIYYFYELFLFPHSVNLLRQPAFWICTALLFFYAFTYPIYGLSNLMMSLPKTILKNLERIVYLLNVLLYSMFSIAFLCRIKIQKYSRS